MPSGIAVDVIPKILNALSTEAQLANQGYTYNQAGYSYNQLGVQYGGIYNYEDVVPIIGMVWGVIPSIADYDAFSTIFVKGRISVGPGFFMLILEPE